MTPDKVVEKLKTHLRDAYGALTSEKTSYFNERVSNDFICTHGPTRIVLAAELTDQEKVYMLTHFATHMIFGHHNRQAASIIEPSNSAESHRVGRAKIDEQELRQHQRAEVLTGGILGNLVGSDWDHIAEQLGENADQAGLEYVKRRALLLREQLHPFTMKNIGPDSW